MKGLNYILFVTETPYKELAYELKVTAQMVTNWAKGTKPIADKHLPKLKARFGVSESYFAKELTLQDKMEIEMQLASKAGKYESVEYQALVLHEQSQAVKEKYLTLLTSVQDYTLRFNEIEKDICHIQTSLLRLVQDETILRDPSTCEKVFGLLTNIQNIRKNTEW